MATPSTRYIDLSPPAWSTSDSLPPQPALPHHTHLPPNASKVHTFLAAHHHIAHSLPSKCCRQDLQPASGTTEARGPLITVISLVSAAGPRSPTRPTHIGYQGRVHHSPAPGYPYPPVSVSKDPPDTDHLEGRRLAGHDVPASLSSTAGGWFMWCDPPPTNPLMSASSVSQPCANPGPQTACGH